MPFFLAATLLRSISGRRRYVVFKISLIGVGNDGGRRLGFAIREAVGDAFVEIAGDASLAESGDVIVTFASC